MNRSANYTKHVIATTLWITTLLGIGTNIGARTCEPYEVTVFDMDTFEVVKRIPVLGPTESPAALRARAIVVGLENMARQGM